MQNSSIFYGLNCKLINLIPEILNQGVRKGHFIESKFADKLFWAKHIEAFSNGLFILMDNGIHILIFKL